MLSRRMSCGLQRSCPAAEVIESVSFFPPWMPRIHCRVKWLGLCFYPSARSPHSCDCGASLARISQRHQPTSCRNPTSTPPDPRPPHPNPGIAPRCQSHTSARRSDQSRTGQGSSIRVRLRLADLRRPGDCPAQRLGARGAGRFIRKPQ